MYFHKDTHYCLFKEAQERAPSAVMSALVEKLRSDLAEKEKKHRAMGRALVDLKKYNYQSI